MPSVSLSDESVSSSWSASVTENRERVSPGRAGQDFVVRQGGALLLHCESPLSVVWPDPSGGAPSDLSVKSEEVRNAAPDRRRRRSGLCACGLRGAGRIRQRRAGASFPDGLLIGTPGVVLAAAQSAAAARASRRMPGEATPRRTRAAGVTFPAEKGLIVLAPALEGRVLGETRAWGYPPAIDEAAGRARGGAMRSLPWLRWDADRMYARRLQHGRPGEPARACAPAGRLRCGGRRRLGHRFLPALVRVSAQPADAAEQAKATRELGGTPARVWWLYARRSPAQFARTIAFSGVPAADLVEPTRGRGRPPGDDAERRLRAGSYGGESRCSRRADRPFASARRGLPLVHVASGDGRLPARAPATGARPPGFSYRSWHPRAQIWGWRFRAGHVGRGFWRIQDASDGGFPVWSPSGSGHAAGHATLPLSGRPLLGDDRLERALVGAERPRRQAGHDQRQREQQADVLADAGPVRPGQHHLPGGVTPQLTGL